MGLLPGAAERLVLGRGSLPGSPSSPRAARSPPPQPRKFKLPIPATKLADIEKACRHTFASIDVARFDGQSWEADPAGLGAYYRAGVDVVAKGELVMGDACDSFRRLSFFPHGQDPRFAHFLRRHMPAKERAALESARAARKNPDGAAAREARAAAEAAQQIRREFDLFLPPAIVRKEVEYLGYSVDEVMPLHELVASKYADLRDTFFFYARMDVGGGSGAGEATASELCTMSLREFLTFCKDCRLAGRGGLPVPDLRGIFASVNAVSDSYYHYDEKRPGTARSALATPPTPAGLPTAPSAGRPATAPEGVPDGLLQRAGSIAPTAAAATPAELQENDTSTLHMGEFVLTLFRIANAKYGRPANGNSMRRPSVVVGGGGAGAGATTLRQKLAALLVGDILSRAKKKKVEAFRQQLAAPAMGALLAANMPMLKKLYTIYAIQDAWDGAAAAGGSTLPSDTSTTLNLSEFTQLFTDTGLLDGGLTLRGLRESFLLAVVDAGAGADELAAADVESLQMDLDAFVEALCRCADLRYGGELLAGGDDEPLDAQVGRFFGALREFLAKNPQLERDPQAARFSTLAKVGRRASAIIPPSTPSSAGEPEAEPEAEGPPAAAAGRVRRVSIEAGAGEGQEEGDGGTPRAFRRSVRRRSSAVSAGGELDAAMARARALRRRSAAAAAAAAEAAAALEADGPRSPTGAGPSAASPAAEPATEGGPRVRIPARDGGSDLLVSPRLAALLTARRPPPPAPRPPRPPPPAPPRPLAPLRIS